MLVQVLISFDIKAQPVVVVVFVLVLFLNVFRYQASLVFKIVWPQNTNYPAIIPLLQLFKHQHFYRISSIVNQQVETTYIIFFPAKYSEFSYLWTKFYGFKKKTYYLDLDREIVKCRRKIFLNVLHGISVLFYKTRFIFSNNKNVYGISLNGQGPQTKRVLLPELVKGPPPPTQKLFCYSWKWPIEKSARYFHLSN